MFVIISEKLSFNFFPLSNRVIYFKNTVFIQHGALFFVLKKKKRQKMDGPCLWGTYLEINKATHVQGHRLLSDKYVGWINSLGLGYIS